MRGYNAAEQFQVDTAAYNRQEQRHYAACQMHGQQIASLRVQVKNLEDQVALLFAEFHTAYGLMAEAATGGRTVKS